MKRSIRNLVIQGRRPKAARVGPDPTRRPPSCEELGCRVLWRTRPEELIHRNAGEALNRLCVPTLMSQGEGSCGSLNQVQAVEARTPGPRAFLPTCDHFLHL